MVTVRVRALLDLRAAIGARESILTLREGATIKDLLQLLFERYGRGLKDGIVDQDGKIHRHLTILVNGREISFLNGIETRLTEDDVISIIPPVGGG